MNYILLYEINTKLTCISYKFDKMTEFDVAQPNREEITGELETK